MLKQLALVLFLTAGIRIAVNAAQTYAAYKSNAYQIEDFTPVMGTSEKDSNFQSKLDILKDGVINVFDIIKDRLTGQATPSSSPSPNVDSSGELPRVNITKSVKSTERNKRKSKRKQDNYKLQTSSTI